MGASPKQPMRRLLLWMAKNDWMRRHLPNRGSPAAPFVGSCPGRRLKPPSTPRSKFKEDGFTVLFTRLGETLTGIDDGDETANAYLKLLSEAKERGLEAEVSVKLTQLGFDIDEERALGHMKRLAEQAAPDGRTVWIDMEGSAYTESTIAFYERLKQTHPNVGLCLQAYLKRTYTDVERLAPINPRIRLVKGAYAEPAEIAYQSRREVDANYLALCVSMLARGQGGPRPVPGHGHARRRPDQAGGRSRAVDRAAEDHLRHRDALRHQDRPAASAEEGRVRRPRAHRVRRGLVSVVHAAARRAAGQRGIRAAAAVAVMDIGRDVPAAAVTDKLAQAIDQLSGVWNIVPTPFHPDETLDLDSVRVR